MSEKRKATVRAAERELDEVDEIVSRETDRESAFCHELIQRIQLTARSNGNGDLEYPDTFANEATGKASTFQIRSGENEA